VIFEDFMGAHETVLGAIFATAFIMGAVVNKTNFAPWARSPTGLIWG